MLAPGNHKLGRSLIWGFGLPSGTPDTCPGLSDACRSDCYAVAVERYRPTAAARYRATCACPGAARSCAGSARSWWPTRSASSVSTPAATSTRPGTRAGGWR